MAKIMSFDMDGTIVDLYNVPGWLEKLEAEDESPYIDAKPLCDMDELRRVVLALIADGWEIRIISWLAKFATPEFSEKIRKAKNEWLDRYKFPAHKVHLIAYGTDKKEVLHHVTNPCVLIDDDKRVRDDWTIGDTIIPTGEYLPYTLEHIFL